MLLIDHTLLDVKTINGKESLNESFDIRSKMIVKGVIQRAEAKNQNGRIYPKHILELGIQSYKENEIAQKRAFGELDHPEDTTINYRNVSHVIIDIWMEGNDVWAEIELLNTPSGMIAKEIVLAGYALGISSRGMGSVTDIGNNTSRVEEDFKLICWDLVTNPSTHFAFVGLNESKKLDNVTIKENNISSLITDIICEISGVCCLKEK